MKERFSLLRALPPGATESEIFQLALHHAMGELGALGGFVHLRGPMSALRLVSVAGLPRALSQRWEILDQEGPLAPARALQKGRCVWGPAHFAGGPAGAGGGEGPQADGSRSGGGLAAVPLYGGGRGIGALSVVTADESEPTGEQWEFLRAVVAWAEDRISDAPQPSRPTHRAPSGEWLRQALKEVQVGSWDWDIRTGDLVWDEAALELYGTRPADFTGNIENWMRIVHPDDLPPTLAAAQRAIAEHTVYEAEYRVRRLDGTYGWTQARGRATYDEQGQALRMVGVGWESNEPRSARDALGGALRHMSDGFVATDTEWHIIFTNLAAEHMLGFPEEELAGRLLWDIASAWQASALEDRCRRAAAGEEPWESDVRMPDSDLTFRLRLVPGPDGHTLYFNDVTERRRMAEEQRASEHAAAGRAARIAELNADLARAVTSQDVVDAVARRFVFPFAASGLLVQVIEHDRLNRVGATGYSEAFLSAIDHRPLGDQDSRDPAWDAIVLGEALFFSTPEELIARYPATTRLDAQDDKRAWAFLPLTASGRSFGVCVISFDQPRVLLPEERAVMTTVTALVAQSLERARLYDVESSRSRELQRSLLPQKLPVLPACTAAARYLPAGQGAAVGGDWYDVLPLSGNQVALVVGDVMGHGLPEAATMGRLRTAVHTLADLELPPDEIMSHLNSIVDEMGDASYVTCLYALYDPTTRLCSITSAGHPSPALLHPDGTVLFPHPDPDPPLGAAEPPFETVEIAVPEGSVLVLYTDGLVESSARDIDTGMAELAKLLSEAGKGGGLASAAGLEDLCQTLTARLLALSQQAPDDAALLVAALHALPPDRISALQLHDEPQAASRARRHVRDQLAAWGLNDLVFTTELLVSELIGNVVRHSRGPIQLRLLYGDELTCEVYDASQTMPRIQRAADTDEGGRGLQLVAAMASRWGARYTPTGKCIWTEQPLPGDVTSDAARSTGTVSP
ncbi:SpoIIE family protein phosphatase [Streptomyces sp. NPDC047000]|uniref:SpoIIE family protein phosphatase n=1 Tax=Streptomyces sp. NPDC047000 TaxID=3155474 RepID=UPI00340B8672